MTILYILNKRDLSKLSKLELIKMLLKLKKVHNQEDLLDNDPFKDKVQQPIALPQKPTRRNPPRDPKEVDSLTSIQIDKNHQSNLPYKG